MHRDCICNRFNDTPCRLYYVGRSWFCSIQGVRNTVTCVCVCVYWGPDSRLCHWGYTVEIIFHLVSNIACTSYRSSVFMSLQNVSFRPEVIN